MTAPVSSFWMSLRLAIPGELLSSIARSRFANHDHPAFSNTRSSSNNRRTATVPLLACLTLGVHCIIESLSQVSGVAFGRADVSDVCAIAAKRVAVE